MFNIVLVEPEIPQNTGNIVRTCAATGCRLHLVRPLGFEVSDKYLKRAGLDYWHFVDITYYDSVDELFEQNPDGRFYFFSTKAAKTHSDVQYREGDFLVFGKETKGLPEPLLAAHYKNAVRIPMIGEIRSLNLSNSRGIFAAGSGALSRKNDGSKRTNLKTDCWRGMKNYQNSTGCITRKSLGRTVCAARAIP